MLSEAFDRALVFAHQLHRKQKRKTSGVPYVVHLLAVASSVLEDGGSEAEAIAALLHDSLEDQGWRYPGGGDRLRADIERMFGGEVRRLVEALTENLNLENRPPAKLRQDGWRAHKLNYLDAIGAADESVRRISCADSLHNVRSMTRDHRLLGDDMWQRFKTKSGADQLWFYDLAARAFLELGPPGLARELDEAVDEFFAEMGAERPARSSGDSGYSA